MTGSESDTAFVLQHVIFPAAGVSQEPKLFYRIDGQGRYDAATGHIHLEPGGRLLLDTYFNAVDLGEWSAACGLKALAFVLRGLGPVRVRAVTSVPDGKNWRTTSIRKVGVVSTVAAEVDTVLTQGTSFELDVSQELENFAVGDARVLHIEIEAGDDPVEFNSGQFITRDTPAVLPKLAISITTFKREAEVEATARRLSTFLESFEHRDRTWVQIVDNGQSVNIEPAENLRIFPNPNLGGAGGFARGLIEARAAGASHCLFMDDDASFHIENIRRTYALLALARDPKTAVAGAMITNARKYEMFENGAIFDGICRPRHMNTDLRERETTYRMLFRATDTLPGNAYGGWWYFAFPIARARHLPFPFFVRGDDSGFALANRFHIRTLNGVVSFQDSFGEKESPLINYLDARYHLLHHIVFEDLDRGSTRNAMVSLRLILRSIAKFHYEAAEAQLLAMRDVMRGPDFFIENADMAARRKLLGEMRQAENWRDLDVRPTPLRKGNYVGDKLWALTLNGLLLPLFGRFGAKRVLRVSMRGPNWPVWGAREITYVNRVTKTGYTVRLDRRRAFGILKRALGAAWALRKQHDALVEEYRGRYDELTGEALWRRLLDLDAKV